MSTEVRIEASATPGYKVVYADGLALLIPDNFARLIADGALSQRRPLTVGATVMDEQQDTCPEHRQPIERCPARCREA